MTQKTKRPAMISGEAVMRTALLSLMVLLFSSMQIPTLAAKASKRGIFERLHNFSDNLAAVSVNGKWGFINEDGKMVVKPAFHEARQFHQGHASVKLVDKWGVINRKGLYIIDPAYDDMGVFAEDLLAVKVDGKWGYINKSNKMVIPSQFSEALPFSSGFAAVRIDANWGFIDSNGKFTINPRFAGAGAFANGLAPVQVNDLWGFIDTKGDLQIKPRFQSASSFSDGLAAAQEDSLWGYIDTKGHLAINPQYEKAQPFSENLAAVKLQGAWGYIDRKGKTVIAPSYHEAEAFSNGIARVVSGSQATYITPAGQDAGIATAAMAADAPAQAAQQPVAALPAAAPQPLADSGTFTVTPLAGMSGGNNSTISGSISPSTPQSVNANGTLQFTIKPTAGTSVTVPLGGTCGGYYTGNPADSVNGITYITNPVTYDCTVEVPSFPPLTTQAWQNTVVPKHRAIISFMDTNWNIRTFRGQPSNLQNSDTYVTLLPQGAAPSDLLTTMPADLGVDGSPSSRVFSLAQTAGVVPQTVTLSQPFMGTTAFNQVPTGMLCSSYLTMLDSNGVNTGLWIELTGASETTGQTQRFNKIQLTNAPKPAYYFKFNGDGSKVFAPYLDRNVTHNIVSWDWDGDGYTDYLVSYIYNPSGNNSWANNMKVALVFIDGKSLYAASQGLTKQVIYWSNTDSNFTANSDMVGGLTNVQPSNSVSMAIGDMDGDKKPEVSLYYTKAQAPASLARNNELKILRLVDAGTATPYSDTSKAPTFTWVQDYTTGSGQSYLQYDSVALAMGDLDGDQMDELAVLHGKTSAMGQSSTLYLDVYKMNSDKTTLAKPISAEQVGTTSKMPSQKYSTPSLNASIADLDGDEIGELIWTGTDSSSSNQLWLVVHKWAIVAASPGNPQANPPVPATPQTVNLTGIGTKSSYKLNNLPNLSSWTLDPDYIRYSMTTGRFVYPDASKTLRKQIGLVTTFPNSQIFWGIFRWDWDTTASTGTLIVLGNGRLPDNPATQTGNIVPSIVAADLDRDSMVLGQPTLITVTDSYAPFFIVQSPPRHFDMLSEVRDSSGNPKMMDAFSEFDGYSSMVTQGSEQAVMASTTTSSAGTWGVSAGFAVGEGKNNYIPPPLFAAGLSYAGNCDNNKTATTGTVMSQQTEATAETDDQLYYWVNDLDVWLYPILYPASQAMITDANGVTSRNFIRYIVPRVSGTTLSATDGKDVDWYEPYHNPLNLFSYPRSIADTKDYPQGAASKPANSWWTNVNGTVFKSGNQLIGNSGETQFSFSITDTSQSESLKSVQHTIAPYINVDPQHEGHLIDGSIPIDLSGSGSWGSQTTSSNDDSSLSGIVMNWPGATNYSSRSGLTTSDQKFNVIGAIYTSDAGTFSLAYAVSSPLKSADSKIWGTASPYNTQADPALNLPSYYENNGGTWSANDAARESTRIRGLQLTGNSVFTDQGIRGQALPIGSAVTGTLRVYNYSFVPTGNLTVSFKFQPISATTFEPPNIASATIDLGTQSIASIYGRDQNASSDNWVDMPLSFAAPTQVGLGYLHATILLPGPVTTGSNGAPVGGNLNINNDTGQVLVGFYDPQTTGASAVKSGAVKRVSGPRSLKIVADSMLVYPIKASHTLGEATTSLAAGQKAVVEAQIRYDDIKGAKTGGILHVNVYLRSNKGIVSHKIIPLLISGRAHTVRMPYTAPRKGASVPLQMLVSSTELPVAADSKPQGRIAKALLTISKP